MNTISRFAAGFALAATCAAASAQTAPAVPASAPTAVAVTPETARAANEQAIPRSDVATVVRTGPTAADKARQAKSEVQSKAANALATEGTTVASGNTNGTAIRAPRTDRN